MKYRAGVGQGEGCLPSIGGKKMEIRKCLDDLYAKHIFNFKIVKIGPHFCLRGGGGHAERKWWKNGELTPCSPSPPPKSAPWAANNFRGTAEIIISVS